MNSGNLTNLYVFGIMSHLILTSIIMRYFMDARDNDFRKMLKNLHIHYLHFHGDTFLMLKELRKSKKLEFMVCCKG